MKLSEAILKGKSEDGPQLFGQLFQYNYETGAIEGSCSVGYAVYSVLTAEERNASFSRNITDSRELLNARGVEVPASVTVSHEVAVLLGFSGCEPGTCKTCDRARDDTSPFEASPLDIVIRLNDTYRRSPEYIAGFLAALGL